MVNIMKIKALFYSIIKLIEKSKYPVDKVKYM